MTYVDLRLSSSSKIAARPLPNFFPRPSHQADGDPVGAFNSPLTRASMFAAVVLVTLVLGGRRGESARFHVGYMLGATAVPALLTLPTFLIWRIEVNRGTRQTKAASFNTLAVIFTAMFALMAALKSTVPAWANAEIARMESKSFTPKNHNPFDRSGSGASERKLQPWKMDWSSAATAEEGKV